MTYRIVAFCAVQRGRDARPLVHMANLLLRSAVHHGEQPQLTILSDRETDLSGLESGAVVRFDLDTANLMLARTQAQASYVAGYEFDAPLAFLDLDILVNRALEPLFGRSFDIGLTVRRKAEMAINGGVIFANNERPEAVRAFFDRFFEVFLASHRGEAAWWGDQRALADLVPATSADAHHEKMLTLDGVEYLLLPGSQYNHSPHLLWASLAMPRRRKFLVHFKGDRRKRFMQAYFDLHMNTTRAAWPLRVLNAYRSVR